LWIRVDGKPLPAALIKDVGVGKNNWLKTADVDVDTAGSLISQQQRQK
jgi:hypothetical protein